MHPLSVKRWSGKEYQWDTYRPDCIGVPLRDGADGLLVNWCELTTAGKGGKVIYYNAFATDHPVTSDNVAACVAAGRGRWKVENENNNTPTGRGRPKGIIWSTAVATARNI